MTSLTVEMGLRRRRGDSPPVPEEIAGRDDMTLAQKQRLAVLAKMGVGPVAAAPERMLARPEIRESIGKNRGGGAPPPVDRRAILMERERRMREQEEKQREEEEKAAEQLRKKKQLKFSGLSRLGPVMPREEDIPQFLPAPAPEPEVRRYRDASKEVVAQEPAEEVEEAAKATGKKQKPAPVVEEQQKQKQAPKKKRRKRGSREEGLEEANYEEEDWEDEEDEAALPNMGNAGSAQLPPQQRKRDGGISKQTMVVESVKGKVSHANKNLTDADLERRFPLHDSGGAGQGLAGSLMTEEEVLRLIRKERKEKGSSTASAARRVQRELAEWENAKEVQRARVKSPHRFERMVVARK